MNNPKCCNAVAGGGANLGLPVRINGTERQGRDCRRVTKAKSPGLGGQGTEQTTNSEARTTPALRDRLGDGEGSYFGPAAQR
jgi:hypothetical protein